MQWPHLKLKSLDLLTVSLSFATVVGLIAEFKSERKESSDDEYKVFIDWLTQKRHLSVVKRLTENKEMALSIQELLNQNHTEVVARLEGMDQILRGIASRLPSFSGLVTSVSTEHKISDQSLSIITQFVESEASFLIELTISGDVSLIVGDGKGGAISIEDQRFLHDDMSKLYELDFLKADRNGQGSRVWRITRSAEDFVNQTKQFNC